MRYFRNNISFLGKSYVGEIIVRKVLYYLRYFNFRSDLSESRSDLNIEIIRDRMKLSSKTRAKI